MSAVIHSQRSRSAAANRRYPLASGDLGRTVAFVAGQPVTLGTFFAQVRGLAERLPAIPFAVNLCEDRYRFLVAFCAVALRGQTTLLPPARTRSAIDEVRTQHPDSYCIGDLDPCGCEAPALSPLPHFLRMPDPLPELDGPVPDIEDAHLVAIGFTSGSTGTPKPNRKHWATFRIGTAHNLEALADLWPTGEAPAIVATVPAQHMYGIELSVLFPLLAGAAVDAGRPFFPADVADSLRAIAAPRVLVTTPVHLRALLESDVPVPPLAAIVSATAPLPQALAAACEARFGCEVREVFGSTETCIIARRRTALETAWRPFAGVRLSPQPDGTLVERDCLPAAVALADLVELQPDGSFVLCGRQADLLEIAGKRASLADLTRRLLAIPGVDDGAIVQLDEADAGGVRRIAAVAVAPGLDEDAIHAALRRSLDPVFLPRRVRLVAQLPRNDTGKLPRAALLALLRADRRG